MIDRPTPETDDIARGNHVVPTEWAKQLERERDEARRKLNNLDVTAIHSCHNECQRPICVLRRERDEAREVLKHISEYGTEEINAAVELRQKLATALVERDEALEKLSARWRSLRDSQDEVLRLTFENRKLRNLSNE
jgi:hypothetical protein